MADKKRTDRAFIKRDHKIDFKEKKLAPLFDKWLDNRFIEEITLDKEEKIAQRKPIRN